MLPVIGPVLTRTGASGILAACGANRFGIPGKLVQPPRFAGS
jgi:hypothetical protein